MDNYQGIILSLFTNADKKLNTIPQVNTEEIYSGSSPEWHRVAGLAEYLYHNAVTNHSPTLRVNSAKGSSDLEIWISVLFRPLDKNIKTVKYRDQRIFQKIISGRQVLVYLVTEFLCRLPGTQ